MTSVWVLIAALALATAALKVAGPLALGGRPLPARALDVVELLASALLANGVSLVGRSFKYHRPRGVLSAGSEEPSALVTVGEGAAAAPNVKATVQEAFDGLVARSQNRWPSLGLDIGAASDILAPFLGAGFYYKTFMWPAAFWEKLYEPIIRRAAGLGSLSREADPDVCDKGFLHCDLLVIGAGPSGLMAALTAGRAGASIVAITSFAGSELTGHANWTLVCGTDAYPAARELLANPVVALSVLGALHAGVAMARGDADSAAARRVSSHQY